MLPLILFALFLIGIDVYSFWGIKSSVFVNPNKLFYIVYGLTSALTIAGVSSLIYASMKDYSIIPLHVNLLFGMAFSFIMAKLFMTCVFLVEDVFRGFIWIFQTAIRFKAAEMIERGFWTGIGLLVLSSITFIVINMGVWVGRYNFKVHHKTLEFANLPAAFDGFKIAQISDLHLGTFDQIDRVKKGLDKLQNENPDLILFTGDFVNNRAREATPFIDIFKSINAPYGKFSILGNHDYGEYVRWKSKNEREENMKQLQSIAFQMGFTGLYNAQSPIIKGSDTLHLVGIENWGVPPFPQYGNLDKALGTLTEKDFIILLSHDPSHWKAEVLASPAKIELTLSGHTHGMQFGFELGKFKWSPVQYKYKEWAGLFEENGQFLYVNRGFGSIGYPGRIGIRPEITIIELKRKK
jgi:predicted MPP superfamily phosphohydrolase